MDGLASRESAHNPFDGLVRRERSATMTAGLWKGQCREKVHAGVPRRYRMLPEGKQLSQVTKWRNP
jgi:hypothetical protein